MKPTDTLLAHPSVAIATPANRDAVANVLFAAFANDPVARWFFPDDEAYRAGFFPVMDGLGGGAFAHRTAYHTEGYTGAALWLPPGVDPDEAAIGGVIERMLDPEKRPTAFDVFEAMGRGHPQEPHWYLPLIGVLPDQQNRGIGSALLAASLAKCDEAGLPAYLESSNPRNIPLHLRHGFEITGEIRIGTCPPIVPMIRPRRR